MNIDVLANKLENLEEDMRKLEERVEANKEKIHMLELSYARVIGWGAGAAMAGSAIIQLFFNLVK